MPRILLSGRNLQVTIMALSPMMEKYLETKKEYPDCLLFYRLGDFYEMFFDDAEIVSKELGLTLTGKDCGMEERAPMCGVPYHAVDQYLTKLALNGHKIAIAEQMEDPKLAKGLVKREVIRVVTPGTLLDSSALDDTKNRYVMCISYIAGSFGIALSDVTTGDFFATEVDTKELLYDIISQFQPSEAICNEPFKISGADLNPFVEKTNLSLSFLEESCFRLETTRDALLKHFALNSLEAFGLEGQQAATISSGALLNYLLDTQKNDLKHIREIKVLHLKGFMLLDRQTRRNLELTETMRENNKRGTLLWVLDKTKTAMGARTLRKMVEQPLVKKQEILYRQGGVSEFFSNPMLRAELREYLNPVYDLERLLGRISYGTANPRDLLAFGNSISMIPHIKRLLIDAKSDVLSDLRDALDEMEDIASLISEAISDDPPVLVHEGGIIKTGYNEDVDRYRSAKSDGKSWLISIEESEREKTGIKSLKIKYNKVFGYYIEVTNSFKDMVPDYFIRKQTLVGAERYITPELKELEDTILGAEERLSKLEFELFRTVRDTVAGEMERIQKTATALAMIDALQSLAEVAYRNNYVLPKINEKGRIEIVNGRHPVVELMMKEKTFVPNDTFLNDDSDRIMIITGPNMAGKSTYMRQTALLVLMA